MCLFMGRRHCYLIKFPRKQRSMCHRLVEHSPSKGVLKIEVCPLDWECDIKYIKMSIKYGHLIHLR